ncbi:MAG: ABC transporter ATP-binding protein [Oscillospiraceae bacterium]
MASIIKLVDVHKQYNIDNKNVVVNAVNGINLTIEEGDLLAIKGESGCGKSTMLYMLGCIEYPTKGQYYLDGELVSSFNKKKISETRNKKIGFVFQDFGLIEEETVIQNIKIPILIGGIFNKEKQDYIDNLLTRFNIIQLKQKKVSQLSGGQRQRVALARALANDPDIILADEPTGALDNKMSEEIMKAFIELNNQGKTIIIVTHEDFISQFCKKTINMCDGKLIT